MLKIDKTIVRFIVDHPQYNLIIFSKRVEKYIYEVHLWVIRAHCV